jgi:uncharacterized protein (DUF486 family)
VDFHRRRSRWGLAFVEHGLAVPANRYGSRERRARLI